MQFLVSHPVHVILSILILQSCLKLFIAPSSSPTSITVVSTTTTSITVNWMHDTSDADGYVVYYNGTAKLVEGGDMKETMLDGLIPGTSYSITVRAYQDILGSPSTTLNTATDDGKLDLCQ